MAKTNIKREKFRLNIEAGMEPVSAAIDAGYTPGSAARLAKQMADDLRASPSHSEGKTAKGFTRPEDLPTDPFEILRGVVSGKYTISPQSYAALVEMMGWLYERPKSQVRSGGAQIVRTGGVGKAAKRADAQPPENAEPAEQTELQKRMAQLQANAAEAMKEFQKND